MKGKIRVIQVLVFSLALLFFGISEIALAQVVQEFSVPNGAGKVDWEEGYIYGKAIGTADMSRMVNRVQAEQVSLTTARHLAYGVISETINRINIDARSIYRQQIMVDDILKVETKGVIENAHAWKEQFRWDPDGSPRAEVIVRVPIHGGLSKVVTGWVERQLPKEPPPPRFELPPVPPLAENFTGLIIDAGGKGVSPVMVPRVLVTEGSKLVYGPGVADPQRAMVIGFAGWARSVDMAKKNDRVGPNPLVVKAQRAEGVNAGDMVVSEEDAKRMAAANSTGQFLKDCKVVIVVN